MNKEIKMEMSNPSPCSVCGNIHNNSKYAVSEMMFGFRDEFEYLECSKCGCLQIINVPLSLAKYYPSEYYSFKMPESNGSKLRRFFLGRQTAQFLNGNKLVSRMVCWLMPLSCEYFRVRGLLDIKLSKKSRILDVGCGSGDLLFFLAEAGFRNPLGIDAYVESDIIYGNGDKVRKATLQDISGEYDLIMFQHSFEHMPNQLETLHRVNHLLAKNGVCLLNMPTVSSYAWKHYKENWVQLDAPRHLFIHSQDSIRMLACKAGFEVSKVVYNSLSFQFWGSIQYQNDIPLKSNESYGANPSKSMFSRTQIIEFQRQAKELNTIGQGDAAAFYLKHRKTNSRE